ncbi:MAG: LysR family transcriptional regulator, partial [Paracoccaceae bacterium]
ENLMTAAQLRTLIAVANTGSFTLAARQLGLSQPTIHRSARGLEELAKTTLFHARSSGVALTSVASAFAQEVKLAQAEIRQGIEEIMHILGSGEGSFVLGSLPLARTMIVPKAVNAMVKENTPIQIRVVDGRYMELLRSLREGDLDCMIGALRFPPPSDDIVQEVLFQDGLVIVAHPSHPLAGRRNIPLEDTLSYPWIAPPKETPAGQYLFETLGIERREKTPVRVVSSSMAVLRGVLTEGPYISVVSRHQVSVEERQGLITPLDVSLKGQFRDIGLTYRKGWRPTSSQAKFIEFLKEFSKDVGKG